MKNKFIARLLSLVTIMVLLYSCRNELTSEQETYNNSSQFKPTSKTISLEQSKHKLILKTELQKAQGNLQEIKTNASGKSVDYANGVSIDTDNVTYIEVGPTFHTYTFNLVRENAPVDAPLENLVLSSLPDGTYKELLVTYNFTPQEKKDLLAGKFVKTAGKGTAIELTKGTYGGVISNRSMGGAESCSYQTVDMVFSCYTGEHHSGNESTWGGCNWQNADGGYPPLHITTVALVCTASTALGDDGAPGGGTGSGDGGGLGSGTNEGTPTLPTFTLPKNTPCGKIKTKFANARFKEKVEALDKPEIFAYDHEMGYAAGYPPANTGITETQYPPMENSIGTHNVRLPEGSQFFGYMHTHNNESGDSAPIKIFSPADVITFLTSCVRNADDHGSIGDAYAMVITSQGNYILQYSGLADFNIGPNQINNWNTWYKREFQKLADEDKLTQPDIEKTFAKFLTESVKINGLEVYQVEKTTGKASKINTDGTKTPCP
ncbi:hypothetical protein [uncultured Chryseobacterium sp.]|uniref:hypothetical protein n=1 Tax=uncultured Chryseobacterium sp. TaxID=259322 RepID=UPI002583A4FB|nr:hypothetical protein [uncultured Chryseobacterium sp.]